MRRREFIAGLGGAATWPVVGWAQRVAMRVVGFLGSRPNESNFHAFREGLQEMSYVEGSNIVFEHRYASQSSQLPALATELARAQVALIIANGTANSALAAKAATATIPILFNNASDPVKLGLVASLNRPGGNITGLNNYQGALG